MPNVVYLWDHYICQLNDSGFPIFHIYTAAAFLLHWEKEINEKRDITSILLLLQKLPTKDWDLEHMKDLISKSELLLLNHPFLVELIDSEKQSSMNDQN